MCVCMCAFNSGMYWIFDVLVVPPILDVLHENRVIMDVGG